MEANFLQDVRKPMPSPMPPSPMPPSSKPPLTTTPVKKSKKKDRPSKKKRSGPEVIEVNGHLYNATEVDLWSEADSIEGTDARGYFERKAQAKKEREAAKARRNMSDESKKKEKEEKKRERRGRSRSGGKTGEAVQEEAGGEVGTATEADKPGRIASIRRLKLFNLRGSSSVDGTLFPPVPLQRCCLQLIDPNLVAYLTVFIERFSGSPIRGTKKYLHSTRT